MIPGTRYLKPDRADGVFGRHRVQVAAHELNRRDGIALSGGERHPIRALDASAVLAIDVPMS